MLNKKVGLIALLASFAASELLAGTLTSYSIGDVLVCFRKAAAGGNDLVVDAGPISTLTNASPNTRISISQFNGGQLALVGTNNVSWSAFTWFDDTISPNWTLFATKARSSLNVQSSRPDVGNASQQQLCVLSSMKSVPLGAVDNRNFKVQNTDTAVVEPDDSNNPNYVTGVSYYGAVGSDADFNGTYPGGNVENTTPGNFITAGNVVRSDFYRLTPTSGLGKGTFLGYFEFSTNGTMTYVAYPSATPVIKSISRSGNDTTIRYTTGLYGTYTLRGTNSLTSGTAKTNWPALAILASGDTLIHTNTDTTTDSTRFYIITAQ